MRQRVSRARARITRRLDDAAVSSLASLKEITT